MIQLLAIGSMLGAFVLAAAVPGAFGTRGPVFAGAYVAVQIGRNLFLVLVARGGERLPEARLLFWFGVSALPWLAAQPTRNISIQALRFGDDYEAVVGVVESRGAHVEVGVGRIAARALFAELPELGRYRRARLRVQAGRFVRVPHGSHSADHTAAGTSRPVALAWPEKLGLLC